ncbi:MAG: PLDc N-terminal domain-containing protein, partial [Gammaproteobacteria bacterium]|nr:PLDc N-terminal domain-containing protein [Gammaproteobacteria bacterium]
MGGEISTLVEPGTLFSVVGLLYLLFAVVAAVHVLLNKENEGAAVSWLGVIILSPLFGALLYWLFGVNRIRRRVRKELKQHSAESERVSASMDSQLLDEIPDTLRTLMRTGLAVHSEHYCGLNQISPLINGDEAYPEMINAINAAQTSVVLSSYIFEYDSAGKEFVAALVEASNRGVLVRVLIDGLGIGYGPS